MHLTQLTARNFRNLASLDVELPPEGVVVLGENGHGKTNLLEAIYYLVLFRSLRISANTSSVMDTATISRSSAIVFSWSVPASASRTHA